MSRQLTTRGTMERAHMPQRVIWCGSEYPGALTLSRAMLTLLCCHQSHCFVSLAQRVSIPAVFTQWPSGIGASCQVTQYLSNVMEICGKKIQYVIYKNNACANEKCWCHVGVLKIYSQISVPCWILRTFFPLWLVLKVPVFEPLYCFHFALIIFINQNSSK